MKKGTKLFSIVLSIAMLFSMFPEMTFVMETENVKAEVISGEAGEDATWSFDTETGMLTYSGTYVEYYGCDGYADEVKKIVFDETVECVFCYTEDEEFTNLEEVVIPASLQFLSSDIMDYSSKLTTITVDENNENYYVQDGNLYLCYEYEGDDVEESYKVKGLCKYIPTKTEKIFTVPDGTNLIQYNAFNNGCTSLEEIIIPETMEELGLECFAGITSLKKVTFLNPETEIYLEDATGLENIVMCGYENTHIHKISEKYGLKFEALPERKVKAMSIKTYPKKMVYDVGRDFLGDGLVLDVEYEDGGTDERTIGYEASGFDSSEPGTCEVTISLGGAFVKFEVEIVEIDENKILNIGIDKEVTFKEVNYDDDMEYIDFYFTPKLSGEYAFYTKCQYDTYCKLYDVNDELLEEADDEEGFNFYLTYELEAGKTYILSVSTFEETGCTFSIKSKLIKSDESHTKHNYISYVTESTDKKDGYTEYICDICGDKYTEYEHKYNTTVVPATCTSIGFTLHECERCGDVYSDNEVQKLEHKYIGTITKAATTTSEGIKEYKCSECGDSYTESIPKLKEDSTAVTDKVQKPGQVKNLKVKVSGKKAKLSWKKIKKVSGYEVRIGNGKKVTKAVKKLVKKNKLTYKKLKKKTYYFKVRAYKTVNGKKVYGKWSKAKKFVVK